MADEKPELIPGNAPDPGTEAFKAKIEESKTRLEQAEAAPKRGRGRPRKVQMPGPAPAGVDPSRPSVSAQPAPTPDISPYLINPLIGASKIPAARTGIPELALTEDEAGACAKSLNDLLNAFAPDLGQMDPKTAAILSASATCGGIIFSKYQIYVKKTAELRATAVNNPDNPGNPESTSPPEGKPVFPTVSAVDHFARPNRPSPALQDHV